MSAFRYPLGKNAQTMEEKKIQVEVKEILANG